MATGLVCVVRQRAGAWLTFVSSFESAFQGSFFPNPTLCRSRAAQLSADINDDKKQALHDCCSKCSEERGHETFFSPFPHNKNKLFSFNLLSFFRGFLFINKLSSLLFLHAAHSLSTSSTIKAKAGDRPINFTYKTFFTIVLFLIHYNVALMFKREKRKKKRSQP